MSFQCQICDAVWVASRLYGSEKTFQYYWLQATGGSGVFNESPTAKRESENVQVTLQWANNTYAGNEALLAGTNVHKWLSQEINGWLSARRLARDNNFELTADKLPDMIAYYTGKTNG